MNGKDELQELMKRLYVPETSFKGSVLSLQDYYRDCDFNDGPFDIDEFKNPEFMDIGYKPLGQAHGVLDVEDANEELAESMDRRVDAGFIVPE